MTAPTLPTSAPSAAQPRVLRDYQLEATEAVCAAWQRDVQGPAVVLPCGAGKTSIIAELARREISNGGSVVLMAHRNELIEQMSAAVVAVDPTGPGAEMIGGVHRGDPSAPIVSVTVQALQRPGALDRLGRRSLLIVDEAHHAVARTYLNVIDHFCGGQGARRAGVTATMIRHAQRADEPALRTVWGEVVYERGIDWAIENGFLLTPHGVTVTLPDLNVDSLGDGRSEISDDEAAGAMMQETTLNATVAAVVDRTGNLSTIVFGSSMDHCYQLTEALVALGVTAETVVGPTSVRTRRGIYRRFQRGETRVLVTVDVLTEGADFPRCEAVVLARPTRSQSRLVQCVGRGLRPHTFEDGRVKDRALVVDLVGAGSLGLIVETELDPRADPSRSSEVVPCGCAQPCSGLCDDTCRGTDCACVCSCSAAGGSAIKDDEGMPCTCSCAAAFGVCRCGCRCEMHRVDPLEEFDPVTGTLSTQKPHRGDAPWSQRTATIRWVRHPRGLARPVYRQTGSRGILMLADMRGVTGTIPGRDWAFGFYDSTVKRMFWIGVDGEWIEPGPRCYLQGMSLQHADDLAQQIFPDHMRDSARGVPTPAQVNFASSLGVKDADTFDRRDLSDLIAAAQAEHWLPHFTRPAGATGTAA